MAEADAYEYRSVQSLKGVGPAVAEKLQKLEIYNIQDVLFHLPIRYEDRTRVTPIGALRPGVAAMVEGVIDHCEVKYGGRRRRSLLCHLSDNTGAVVLRFFHFSRAQQEKLVPGLRLRCFAEPRRGSTRLELIHPEYQFVQAAGHDNDQPGEQSLTPIYPKTEGVHQTLLKKISDQVMRDLHDMQLDEWLPASILGQYRFPPLSRALQAVHRPHPDTDMAKLETVKTPAQQRLVFEELLAHQLSLLLARQNVQRQQAFALDVDPAAYQSFKQRLAFELTQAQERVIAEIYRDIAQTRPMLRLVQGDVGSGKTVVAAAAALAVVAAGRQIAIMAPTEILAEQHAASFAGWFDSDICLLLSGRDKGRARQEKLAKIQSGQAKIVIGTHALFQPDVQFSSLVMMVIDEQHRFGVHQRLALRDKGTRRAFGVNTSPHQLIMTATPIPRSLAMTAYADLDYSVIDELPQGRKPVTTVVVSSHRRTEVIDRIERACEQGQQAYWVCTLVEESEMLQCQAAEQTAEHLAAELENIQVGLVHGRMKADQKQRVVQRFKQGEINLLVATTVIEVGVNVPDASLMVIENAERLGLAQLHQLRGRVGRGSRQSTCVLMYQPPLSDTGKQRLQVLRETSDGFRVAEKDLQLRGPGELLGTRQTGLMQLRIADIVRDEYWFDEVKSAARIMLREHPEAVRPLVRRWLGHADRFSQV
jgi:ATP-dependent DNA helicase RecG